MFMGLFGEFLLQKGYVSSEELRRAYGAVEHARPKLGVLAMNEGYMTADQVETVHSMQIHEDRRFGDIALDMGYLLEEQLQALLSMQRRGHTVLAQALVDQGILSLQQFNDAIVEYKGEYHLESDIFDALTKDDVGVTVRFCLEGKRILEHSLLTEYVALCYRSIIRFVDRFTVLSPVLDEEDDLALEYVAFQLLTRKSDTGGKGGVAMLTALSGNEESLAALGRAFSGEDITSLDALGKAATEEFLNLINGLFSVNMSEGGSSFSLKPPIGGVGSVFEGAEDDLFSVRFRFGDHSVKLFVMDGVPHRVAQRLLEE